MRCKKENERASDPRWAEWHVGSGLLGKCLGWRASVQGGVRIGNGVGLSVTEMLATASEHVNNIRLFVCRCRWRWRDHFIV